MLPKIEDDFIEANKKLEMILATRHKRRQTEVLVK